MGDQRQQPEDADGHVRAVEPRQREERRAKEIAGQCQPVLVERRELVKLAAQKDATQ